MLDEIGVSMDAALVSAPTGPVGAQAQVAGAGAQPVAMAEGSDAGIDDDLSARLNALRK